MLYVSKVILMHEHILQIQYNPNNQCSQVTFITCNFSQNVILMVYMYPTFHLHMHVCIMLEFGHFSVWISDALNFVLVKNHAVQDFIVCCTVLLNECNIHVDMTPSPNS